MPYRFATDVPLLLGGTATWLRGRRQAARLDGGRHRDDPARHRRDDADQRRRPAGSTGARARRPRGAAVATARRAIPHPGFCGVRTERWLFVRWGDGFEELYDHAFDRSEIVNRVADPAGSPRRRAAGHRACVVRPEPPGFSWDVAEGSDASGARRASRGTRTHPPNWLFGAEPRAPTVARAWPPQARGGSRRGGGTMARRNRRGCRCCRAARRRRDDAGERTPPRTGTTRSRRSAAPSTHGLARSTHSARRTPGASPLSCPRGPHRPSPPGLRGWCGSSRCTGGGRRACAGSGTTTRRRCHASSVAAARLRVAGGRVASG